MKFDFFFSLPKQPVKPRDEDDSDEDSDDEEDDGSGSNPEKWIPASMEVNLTHGARPVSALAVDHSGARLVTGSVDYDVKLWDFAGMSASMSAFRTIRPVEWYVTLHLAFVQIFTSFLIQFQPSHFGSSIFHYGRRDSHHFWNGAGENRRSRWVRKSGMRQG